MSRDCTRTYIHLHSPRHADLFEEFNAATTRQPHSAPLAINQLPSLAQPVHVHASGPSNGLPDEDIAIAAHLMPPNPEDEDDIVPDQHAAFGITQAMAQRERADRSWRDFNSLHGLVGDVRHDGGNRTQGPAYAGYAGVQVFNRAS